MRFQSENSVFEFLRGMHGPLFLVILMLLFSFSWSSSFMTTYRKLDLELLQRNLVDCSVCDFRWFNTKSHSRPSMLVNMAVENFSGRTR